MNFVFVYFCCLVTTVTEAGIAISGLQYLLQLAQNAPPLLRMPYKAPILPLIPPIFPMAVPKMLKHRQRYLKVDHSQNDEVDLLNAENEFPLDITQPGSLDLDDDSEAEVLKPDIHSSGITVGIHVVPTPPYPQNDLPVPKNMVLKPSEEEKLHENQPESIQAPRELKSNGEAGCEGLVSNLEQFSEGDGEIFREDKLLEKEQVPKAEEQMSREEQLLDEGERLPSEVKEVVKEKQLYVENERLHEKIEQLSGEKERLPKEENLPGNEEKLLGEEQLLPGEEHLPSEEKILPEEETISMGNELVVKETVPIVDGVLEIVSEIPPDMVTPRLEKAVAVMATTPFLRYDDYGELATLQSFKYEVRVDVKPRIFTTKKYYH